MAKKYDPNVGDVVILNGISYVLISIENRERTESLCYDRTYFFIREEELANLKMVEKSQIKSKAYTIDVKYTVDLPEFIKAESAPYEIRTVEVYNIRKKKAKNVIVYE